MTGGGLIPVWRPVIGVFLSIRPACTCLEAAGPGGGLLETDPLTLTPSDSPGRYRLMNSSNDGFGI